jgi:hypothetical protein
MNNPPSSEPERDSFEEDLEHRIAIVQSCPHRDGCVVFFHYVSKTMELVSSGVIMGMSETYFRESR